MTRDLEKILIELKNQSFYEKQILHIEEIKKTPPLYGELKNNISPEIKKWLVSKNIHLYSHQTEAINSVLDGKDIIVVTSTASGKSLAYNVPVVQSLLTESDSTALYLFPQKALSQDQYSKLSELTDFVNIPPKLLGIYDGDTPRDEKARIRRESRLVIMNPYGLHQYLPFAKSLWIRFFRNLKYIIIDECHQYRGIFGSNFAQVIRRLMRIVRSFRSHPQFILCSATIKNPGEVAEKLTGQSGFQVIDKDGSPNPGRYFVFWDLPIYGDSDLYKSPHTETRYLFNYIVSNDLQTLAFTRSRKMAELNAYYSRLYFKNVEDELLSERIISYRAGISPEDRRRIEKGLRDRDLIGVYATTALELGVDIGSLECTILSGFPGTVSSMWQQVGRAGRKYTPDTGIESLSFLVPMSNPLDLYYVRHPEELMEKSHELCNINLENPYILKNHLKCAAKEAPLSAKDKPIFGSKYENMVNELEEEGVVKKKGERYWYNSTEKFPPGSVNLSGISNNDYKVILQRNNGQPDVVIYEQEGYVYKELHSGAIYLYMAEPYKVKEFDPEEKTVHLVPADGKTYTDSRVLTDIHQLGAPDISKTEDGINIYYGDVKVTEKVVSYDIFAVETNTKLSNEPLDLPPANLETKAVWFSIPPEFIEKIESKGYDFDGSIHGIEHAAIGMAPYFTLCDRWDIGGVSTRNGGNELSNWPVIYIYDGFPGGIGIAEKIYDFLISLLQKTRELIKSCKCKEKCPGCVMSPKCGNNNEPLDKHGAIELLDLLLSKSE